MIKSMTLKNVATYDNEGINISDFNKINFIYGSNGSGKTTIANFIEYPQNTPYSDCTINWENDIPTKTLVYNKNFIETNFGKGKLPGIFTIGKASKDAIDNIEKMQNELSQIKKTGIQKKETIELQIENQKQIEDSFKEQVWSKIYKKYVDEFKSALSGYTTKEKFKNKLIEEYKQNKSILKSLEELRQTNNIIFGKKPIKISPIPIPNFDSLSEIERDNIWKKRIVGKLDIEIAKIIQYLNINDWVNEGRKYIQPENDICPFCQRPTIDHKFKEQLEEYFDESYTVNINYIKEKTDEYNRLGQNIISELQKIEINERIKEDTQFDIDIFSAYLKTLHTKILSNKELLNNKIKEPSRSIELHSTNKLLYDIKALLMKANLQIEEHNNKIENYSTEKPLLICCLWKFMVEENKILIWDFIKKTENIQKEIYILKSQREDLLKQYKELDFRIKEANKNITGTQQSIDTINNILKKHDFLNFEIIPSKTDPNYYQIKRDNGDITEATLSEGEKTLITILYFLQLAKGGNSKETVNEDRILVIDDPVSNLDNTMLMLISSLLNEIIKSIRNDNGHIKQLILLTHNIYFYKEISSIKDEPDTSYWILRKKGKNSKLQSFGKNNPIKNTYELLWQELKNKNQNSTVTIKNTMKQIIENYFKITGKHIDHSLIESFENEQEKKICRLLLPQNNENIYNINNDFLIEISTSNIDEYYTVFKKIFEKTGNIEHFNMMTK